MAGREPGARPVHGQVCYLQLPANDVAHCAQFYAAVFGWESGMHGGSEFSAPGVIGQWVTERGVAGPDAGPLLWVCVDGIDDALAQAQVHGGTVVDQAVPGRRDALAGDGTGPGGQPGRPGPARAALRRRPAPAAGQPGAGRSALLSHGSAVTEGLLRKGCYGRALAARV
ncbi:MAG TPA: hypothetical protein VF204_05265 [Streptosporangiaceae bacterium]